ncbi:hypothetical protein LWF01_04020 [Saxibacter everestensis]|uniref:Uncharacterized protein n=1 Tax=Saxibacter everestensis TaxID=2909229 RepID=A0ABY8QV87_9MICO|nr:hypothetical protein LWF01_04020 [Brevibacteriaceae bacterium ZFBP1038]
MVTYRTARVRGASNTVGQRELDVYLRALERSDFITQISYGNYVARVATVPLATAGRRQPSSAAVDGARRSRAVHP